jgi:hypothetical protein
MSAATTRDASTMNGYNRTIRGTAILVIVPCSGGETTIQHLYLYLALLRVMMKGAENGVHPWKKR